LDGMKHIYLWIQETEPLQLKRGKKIFRKAFFYYFLTCALFSLLLLEIDNQ